MPAPSRISLGEIDGVPVVRLLDTRLVDEPAIRDAADQVFAAVPASGPIRLILDFGAVRQVASSMLGKLILLQRRVDASGGLLRLCEVDESIRDVLRTTNLDRLFVVARDRREAREAFGPAGKRP
jgi:anti-sigma B factor antagonist